jgi:hypothetical protein
MKYLLFSVVVVLAAATVRAELTPEQIAKGQQLYTTGCLSCHPKKGGTIEPRAYSDGKWGRSLDKMLRLSKLSSDDRKLLTEYLANVRLGKAPLPKGK